MTPANRRYRLVRQRIGCVSLLKDKAGVAAVEFALVLPLMLVMLLGTLEISNLLMVDRRASQIAATLADLIARDDSLTEADVSDTFFAANAIMGTMPSVTPQMVITSIVDNAGTAKVSWSRAKNASPDSAGATVSGLPSGLLPSGGSILRVKVSIPYTLDTLGAGKNYQATKGSLATSFDYSVANSRTINQTFYMRPRLAAQIPAPTP